MNPRSWWRAGLNPVAERSSQLAHLEELAARRETGALWIDAPWGGTVYLSEGRVGHIESALTPGVETLLLRPGFEDDAQWSRFIAPVRGGQTAAARAAAQTMLQAGQASPAHAEIVRRSAVADAALAVFGTSATQPDASPGQFRPGHRHWWPYPHSWPVAEVLAEVRRRRAVLQALTMGVRVWRPVRRTTGAAVPVIGLSGSQWEVVRLADGVRTPLDIAWLRGHSVFATTVTVHQLARLGLLDASDPTGDPGSDPAGAPSAAGPAAGSAGPAAGPPAGPMTGRHVLSFLRAELASQPLGVFR